MNITSTFVPNKSIRSDTDRTFFLFLISTLMYCLFNYFQNIDIINGTSYYADETSLPSLILYFSIHYSVAGLLSLSSLGLEEYVASRQNKIMVPDLSQLNNDKRQYQDKKLKIIKPYSSYSALKELQKLVVLFFLCVYILNSLVLAYLFLNYITFEPVTCACGH